MGSRFAFTLIELLVVIVIIALLIGVLLPALGLVRAPSGWSWAVLASALTALGYGFYYAIYYFMVTREMGKMFKRGFAWLWGERVLDARDRTAPPPPADAGAPLPMRRLPENLQIVFAKDAVGARPGAACVGYVTGLSNGNGRECFADVHTGKVMAFPGVWGLGEMLDVTIAGKLVPVKRPLVVHEMCLYVVLPFTSREALESWLRNEGLPNAA